MKSLLFSDFVSLCHILENTSSRNSRAQCIAEQYMHYDVSSTKAFLYLVQGLLGPSYDSLVISISDSVMIDIISYIIKIDKTEIKKELHSSGDLGIVAEKLCHKESSDHSLTLTVVFDILHQCAKLQGNGVIQEKVKIIGSLLLQMSRYEKKYCIRIILGKMRLGVSDSTVLQALSYAHHATKEQNNFLKQVYALYSDIVHIATILRNEGWDGLKSYKNPRLFVPIQPALSQRMDEADKILEKLKIPCFAQPKYDGLRVQVHVDFSQRKILYFSRNLLPMHEMFPELAEDLFALCEEKKVNTCIFDGEIMVYDNNGYASFQDTVKRRRIYDIEIHQKNLPARYIIFDCLVYGNEPLLFHPYGKRMELIESFKGYKNIIPVPTIHIYSQKELEDFYENNVFQGFEGIMIKSMHDAYYPGERTHSWIKWKRIQSLGASDTIDGVIIGYYKGQGKRTRLGVGAFLIALYNKERECFQTIAKVGTGLTEKTWIEIREECDKHVTDDIPVNVMCKKTLFPDVWCLPAVVVSLQADEITRSSEHTSDINEQGQGLALRFPRLEKIRYDKNAYQVTNTYELRDIFNKKALPE